MNPFREYVNALKSAHMESEFQKFKKALDKHKRIIILGNGGSNSIASHISQDYMKFCKKRVSIFSDPSMLTMLSNDFGYENAYLKFLEYHVEDDTFVILMSSGGESENIIKCQKYCDENKIVYGVLTGFFPNNRLRIGSKNAAFNYHIDSESYGVVECVHQIFLHGVV
ncbi:MAG: hypothetical protein ACXADH_08945 [Candidatus Kariarchaeaceae archaeon]